MLIRLFLFSTLFILLSHERQLDTIHELHGQSSGRIRSSTLNNNSSKTPSTKRSYLDQQKISRFTGKSTTFIQSRHFHPDQSARDARDLDHPSSLTSPISGSYYQFSYGGLGTNSIIPSLEACRLTSNSCSGDYQCCSGKCRCTKWSVSGQVSCLKKCF